MKQPLIRTLIALPVGTVMLFTVLYLMYTLGDLVCAFAALDMSIMFTHPVFCWERARFIFGGCFAATLFTILIFWLAYWIVETFLKE